MRDLSLLPDLELALIQSELDWHDPAANRARFEPLLDQARGADDCDGATLSRHCCCQ